MTIRRWMRRAVLAVLILIALGLAADAASKAYGQRRLAVARALFEKEVGTLNLTLYRLPAVPDEKNGATWLTAGTGALIFFRGEDEVIARLAAKPASDWSQEEISKIAGILERNADGLAILDRARSFPDTSFGIDTAHNDSARLPPLMGFLRGAKLLRCKAVVEFRRGALEDSTRTMESIGTIASSLEREPTLITLMVGLAIERLQLSALQDLAQSRAVSPALIARLQSAISPVDLPDRVRRELALGAGSMTEGLLSGRIGDLSVLPWRVRRMSDLAAAQFLDLQREESRSWEQPYPVVKAAARRGAEVPLLIRPLWFEANRRDARARVVFFLSQRRLAALALRLRLQAIRSEGYPGDLASTPGAMEPDPFTGSPLHYRLRGDGSAELSSPEAPAMLKEFVPESQLPGYNAACHWDLPAQPPSDR
jgi:hypothetical protein